MKNSTIKKFTKKHYLENDSTVNKLNKVLKVLFPKETYGKTKGTYKFYFENSEDKKEWDMEDNNFINAPVIKVSEFFKEKPSLEARVSKLEKALEIENSLFKAVAEDCDTLVEKKPTQLETLIQQAKERGLVEGVKVRSATTESEGVITGGYHIYDGFFYAKIEGDDITLCSPGCLLWATIVEEPEVIESITVNFMPEIGVYTTEITNNQLEPVALIQRLSDGSNRITKL